MEMVALFELGLFLVMTYGDAIIYFFSKLGITRQQVDRILKRSNLHIQWPCPYSVGIFSAMISRHFTSLP
ncbi:hypothetical protein SCA6_003598 [Theobroma cacao]